MKIGKRIEKAVKNSKLNIFRRKKQESFHDVSDFHRQTLEEVKPYTMTSPQRVFALIDAVQHVVDAQIEGDIVECGVWKGGSMMAAAKALLHNGISDRELYLYDTFEGMTVPTDLDVTCDGKPAIIKFEQTQTGDERSDWCRAPIELVRDAVSSTGYDMSHVHTVKGPVEETIPGTLPGPIAILRLDTDWYESTKHELEQLYPLLVPGGFLIIDDYGHWQGARRAVDEYLAGLDQPMFLHRVDSTGRLAIKAA